MMTVAVRPATRQSPMNASRRVELDSEGQLQALLGQARQLERQAAMADPWVTAPVLFEVEQAISDRIHAMQGKVLGNLLLWNESDDAFTKWASEVTRTLGEAAARYALRAEETCHSDARASVLQRLLVLAIVNRGDATKWETIAKGAPSVMGGAGLHALYRLAERIGQAHAAEFLERGGVAYNLTVEAHYLRVIMLPLVCHGVLNRQQVEIADSWLWKWTPDYRLATSNERGEPGLWVDLAGDGAVRTPYFAPEGKDVRFVMVSALHDQLAEVVRDFHAGIIFPGHGVSTEFRIEEHIAVLDYMQRIWERVQHAHSRRRSERKERGGTRIEGFAGLGEFLDRGYATVLGGAPAEPEIHPLGNLYEIPRRWFHVNDESEHGLGLLADAKQWEHLAVGDLLGVRNATDAYPTLGVVVRKLPARGEKGALLGVEILAREPRRVTLSASDRSEKFALKQFECLYLPGKDSSGSTDSILVPQDAFTSQSNFELAIGGLNYVIAFNRMRRQGRGWVVAGFEIVDMPV
jgi:hypothetical protein